MNRIKGSIQQQASLAEQILQLQRERDDASRRLAALRDDNERLNPDAAELPGCEEIWSGRSERSQN